MRHEYPTLKRLRAGESVEVEGVLVKMAGGAIKAGDDYVGERNTGPKLLVAKEVVTKPWGDHTVIDYIHPTTIAYSFDGHECVRVEAA